MQSAVAKLVAEAPGRDRRTGRRKLAVLRAALIDIGGGTHFCRIVNASSGGFELRLYQPAAEGTPVQLRFASEASLSGTIIWSRGQSAGIRLDKPIDADAFLKGSLDDPGHRRRMPRAIVEASGTLNVGPFGYHANIVDISPAGARVRTIKPLVGVGPVSLRLPHLSAIPARICWFEDSDAGLRFNAPLEMRVLEEWLESERAGSHPR